MMSIRPYRFALLFVLTGLLLGAGAAQAQSVSFRVGEATTVPGDTTSVGVTVSDFTDVTTAQFTLEWDPAVVSFDSTANYGLPGLTETNFGTTDTGNGTLTVSWDDPNSEGVTVADGTTIFRLHVQASGDFNDSTNVAFVDSPTARNVTVNFNDATFSQTDGTMRLTGAPDAPSSVAQTNAADSVRLSWTANTESDLAGYNVYRNTTAFTDPATATKLNASLIADTTGYADASVTAETTYYYRITAVDSDGNEGAASAELVATPGLVYVDADAMGDGTGQTWTDAFASLQDALAIAETGDEIWIAEGTYYPDEGANVSQGDQSASFTLVDDADLFGGFSGTETARSDRDPAANPTILSGDINQDGTGRTDQIVRAESGVTPSTRVDGVRVEGAGGAGNGGGLWIDGGVSITNAVFSQNSIGNNGGAVYGTSSSDTLLIANVRFLGNEALDFGSGGAIYFRGDSLSVVGSSFVGNQAENRAGGVRVNSGSASLINNTFVENESTTGRGGGVYNGSSSPVTVENNIFWGNTADNSGNQIENDGSDLTIRTSIIENSGGSGTNWDTNLGADGGSNLDADPLLKNAAGPDGTVGTLDDNPRLLYGSPALNAGDGNFLPSDRFDLDNDGNMSESLPIDLDAESRVQNSTVDLGAYEGFNAPAAPTALAIEKSDRKVPLDWSPSAPTGIAGYNVYRATSAFSDSITAARVNDSLVRDTAFVDTSVTNGTTYHYRVAAVDSADQHGALSAEASVTPTTREVVYVDKTAIGQADGSSWVDAYTTLQDGLAAATDSSEIWVAEGVYYPDAGEGVTDGRADTSFVIRDDIAIYGGFSGDESSRSARDPQTNRTVLSGDIDQDDQTTSVGVTGPDSTQGTNSYHVVQVASSATPAARLDGVTITGGDASSSASTSDGGGIYAQGDATIARVVVAGNRAQTNGGGLYVAGAPVLANVVITGNEASNHGGGIYLLEGVLQLMNASIRGNWAADTGGGMYLLNASPTLASVSFSGNQAGAGGGLGISSTSFGTSSPTVSNALFWRNNAPRSGPAILNEGDELTLQDAFVQGGTAAIGGSASLTSSGIEDTDPVFVRNLDTTRTPTRQGDLRLQDSSPALGAGDAAVLPADRADLDADGDTSEVLPVALDGSARVQDSALDLGAYEGNAGNPAPAAPDTLLTTAEYGQVVLDWDSTLASDFGSYRVYQETQSTASPSNVIYTSPSGERSITEYTAKDLDPGTTYHFYVTASDAAGNESGFSPEAATQPLAFDTVYVDVDASGDPEDGTSWSSAYRTLQDALQTANQGDRIWVAEGVYYPDEAVTTTVSADDSTETFTIPESVKLYGGFTGTETQRSARDPEANRTILSGDITQNDSDPDGDGIISDTETISSPNTNNLVRANLDTRLDGFVVTGASFNDPNAYDRGVIEAWKDDVIFNQLTVVGNEVTGQDIGVVSLEYDDTTSVTNSRFVRNRTENEDEGLFYAANDTRFELANVVLTGNEGYIFQDNFDNVVFDVSTVTVSAHQGGLWNIEDEAARLTIENSIFWNVSDAGSGQVDGTVTVRHSIIEGAGGSGEKWNSDFGTDGGGNLDRDPRFADSLGADGVAGTLDDDLRVGDTGPAHNAGYARLLPPDIADLDDDGDLSERLPADYLGEARVQDGSLTMGAYEAAVDIAPLPPTGLQANVDPARTTLRWNESSESDVTGYHVYRDTAPFDSVKTATRLTSSPVTGASYVDSDVEAGTAYFYRVTAVDDAGQEGNGSSQVRTPIDRLPPDPPSSLTATPFASSAGLSWSAPDSIDVDGYILYRDTSPIDSTAGPDASTSYVGPTLWDFEDGFPSDWSDGPNSNASWQVVSGTADKGTSSLRSGDPGDNSLSTVETTVDLSGEATIRFAYRVSSEEFADYLRFYVDGEEQLETSGRVDWTTYEQTLSAGRHTLRWEYEKDFGTAVGQDAAWIDNVYLDRVIDTTSFTDADVSRKQSYYYRVTAVDDSSNESAFSDQVQVTPGEDLRVANMDPTSGVAGTPVRIYGAGFDSTAAENTVTFGATAAAVDSVGPSVLYTSVPRGLKGPVPVRVSRASDGQQAMVGDRFNVVTGGDTTFTDISAELEGGNTSSWGDFDGDGDLDLVITGGSVSTIYENEGGGTFTPINAGLAGVDSDGSSSWGDFDGDGDLDLVITGYGDDGPTATVYENEGDGSFSPVGAGLTNVDASDSDWGDFDGDGDLDLIIVGEDEDSTPTATIYENEGGGSFSPVGAGLTVVEGRPSVSWGDFDRDGDPDLVITGEDGVNFGRSATIYENEGSGTFSEVGAQLTGVSNGSSSWGDFDGDGDLDLVITGRADSGDNIATIYENEGGGSFVPVGASIAGVSSSSSSWGDFDGDGDLDLVTTGSQSDNYTATVYENQGGGTFTPIEAGLTGVLGGSSSWGDFDGDGDLDLVLTGGDADFNRTAMIYRNGTGVPPDSPSSLLATGDPSQVDLEWTASDSSSVAEYWVYRDTAPIDSTNGPGNYAPIDTVTATDTTLTDTTVQRSTAYYYRVTAVDSAGSESGFSPEAEAGTFDRTPTAPPSSLTATADGDNVDLTWPAVSAVDADGYRVYRDTAPIDSAAGPASYAVLDSTTLAGDTTLTDTTAAVDSLYYYRVTAVDTADNESAFSPTDSTTVAGDPRIAGTAVDADDNPIPGFHVTAAGADTTLQTRTDSSGTFTLRVPVGTFSVTGEAVRDSTYLSHGSGETSITTSVGDTASVTLDATTGYHLALDSVRIGGATDTLVAAPGDTVALTANYRTWTEASNTDATVYAAAGLDSTATDAASLGTPGGHPGDSSTTSVDLTLPETEGASRVYATYAAQSSATDAETAYESEYPNADRFIPVGTVLVDDGAPSPPDSLAVPDTTGLVELNWQPPATDDLDSIRVYRSTTAIDSSAGPSGLTSLRTIPAAQTTYVDSSAAVDSTYHYRVTATDLLEQESGFSNEVQVTVKKPPAISIAGAVQYYGTNSGVPGVTLALDGGGIVQDTTSATDGTFGFDAFSRQNYTLRLNYENDSSPMRGVTTSDLAFIRDDVLHTDTLSGPYARLAADAEGSEYVSTLDIVHLRRLVLGNTTSLPEGLWRFVPTSADTSRPAFDLPRQRRYRDVQSSRSDQSFVAIKRGDVDRTWPSSSKKNPAGLDEKSAGPPVRLAVRDREATLEQDTLTVPVRAEAFEEVGGIQFTVEWKAKALELLQPTGHALPGLSTNNFGRMDGDHPGQATVVWTEPSGGGHSVAPEDSLFALRFRVKTEGKTDVKITSAVTPRYAHHGETRGARPLIGDPGTIVVEKIPDTFVMKANYPNPARQQTTIEYGLPKREQVTLRLYDVLGRRVATFVNGSKDAGQYEHRVDTARLSSGVYFYRMRAGDFTKTKRMVVVH